MVEGEPTQSVNNEAKYLKKNQSFGEVAEWLKAHAWKVCIR